MHAGRETGGRVRSERGAAAALPPGGELTRPRGGGWTVDGELGALGLDAEDGTRDERDYPDALGRLWSALECPHSGDVLVSATPGFEFMDWGGSDHVGGGSHGSLHRDDSEGCCSAAARDRTRREREQWSLADVTPLVLDHFRVRDA